MAEANHSEEKTYSAEQVRQGEIILRGRTQRVLFIGGLAALVILLLAVQFVHLS